MGGKDKKLSKKILVGRATAAVQDLGQECAGYFRMWTREGNINPTVQAVTQLSRIKKWSGLVRAAWQGLERRRYCSEVDTWQEILPSLVLSWQNWEKSGARGWVRTIKYQLWNIFIIIWGVMFTLTRPRHEIFLMFCKIHNMVSCKAQLIGLFWPWNL